MTIPSWTMKLAAAAVIPLVIGVSTGVSARSLVTPETGAAIDHDYRPGEFGVDFAAVTGPMGPSEAGADKFESRRGDAAPDCKAAVWPNIPATCLGEKAEKPDRRILFSN